MSDDPVWSTKTSDMMLALQIMNKHREKQHDALPLLDHCDFEKGGGDSVRIVLPLWIEEIAHALKIIHGEKQYPFVLSHVIDTSMSERVKATLTTTQVAIMKAIILHCFHGNPELTQH